MAPGNVEAARSAVRGANRKARAIGIAALHRLNHDHSQTIQLVLGHWELDFVSIPYLKLLGECGAEATYLVLELRKFVLSDRRYVRYGWLAGNIWQYEKMVEAAEVAIGKIERAVLEA